MQFLGLNSIIFPLISMHIEKKSQKGTDYMILDIIIVLILLGAAIYGFKKGFVFTLIHTVGWVGAIVLAYLAVPFAGKFIKNNTPLYDILYTYMTSRFDVSISSVEDSMGSIPESILPELVNNSTDIMEGIASSFTNVLYTILLFLVLLILIKVILWFLLRLLSRDYNSGFRHFVDGFFGFLFGLLKGVIFVFLFMVLLVPVSNLFSPEFAGLIARQMDSSLVSQLIYDNNFLLIILQAFFDM